MRSILFSAEFDKQLAGLFSDGEAASQPTFSHWPAGVERGRRKAK